MIGSRTFEDEFAYGFDDPIDTVSYSRAVCISGWLVNIKAQPIHGIRLIARNGLWPRRVTRARRKRSRPDVALEFPDVPDARASGFLIETQLRSGRNQISIQVQDEQKRWRTFLARRSKCCAHGSADPEIAADARNGISPPLFSAIFPTHVFPVGCIFQITARSGSEDCVLKARASPTKGRLWKRSGLARAIGLLSANSAWCGATWPTKTKIKRGRCAAVF
jgi:hypothetical protein